MPSTEAGAGGEGMDTASDKGPGAAEGAAPSDPPPASDAPVPPKEAEKVVPEMDVD